MLRLRGTAVGFPQFRRVLAWRFAVECARIEPRASQILQAATLRVASVIQHNRSHTASASFCWSIHTFIDNQNTRFHAIHVFSSFSVLVSPALTNEYLSSEHTASEHNSNARPNTVSMRHLLSPALTNEDLPSEHKMCRFVEAVTALHTEHTCNARQNTVNA